MRRWPPPVPWPSISPAPSAYSEETVKSHVSSIYAKLGVHTQQELLDVVEVSVAALREGAGPTPFA